MRILSASHKPAKDTSLKKQKDEDEDDHEDDDESEQKEAVTEDSHHVLWLPERWSKFRKRVADHCMEGEGETEALKHRINLGTTDGGNQKVSMLEAEFEADSGLVMVDGAFFGTIFSNKIGHGTTLGPSFQGFRAPTKIL